MRNRFGGPKSYVHTMAILRSQILEHRSPCILYCSFKKRTHPRKSTHLLLWHNFLYRVKVYMNDHSSCSKLCVANRAHLWSQGWEAKPQALCISEVRSFALNFTEAWLCVGHRYCGHAHWLHHAHNGVLPLRVFCAIRTWASKASASMYVVIHPILQRIWGQWVTVSIHGNSFLVTCKCGSTWKSNHPHLWLDCKVLRPWALFLS